MGLLQILKNTSFILITQQITRVLEALSTTKVKGQICISYSITLKWVCHLIFLAVSWSSKWDKDYLPSLTLRVFWSEIIYKQLLENRTVLSKCNGSGYIHKVNYQLQNILPLYNGAWLIKIPSSVCLGNPKQSLGFFPCLGLTTFLALGKKVHFFACHKI